MIERLVQNAGGHVGDAGNSKDANAHVARGDDFGDGGHADEVGTDGAEVTNFGGSFVTWAGNRGVDAFVNFDAQELGFFEGYTAKRLGIGFGHVGKARAKAVIVGTGERIGAEEINVIPKDDEGAGLESEIDAAGGIGKNGSANAETRKDAHGENDFGRRITFVKMDAALHGSDGDAGTFADDKLASVADGGGKREIGDARVGDARGGFELVGKSAEAGAEDDGDLRAKLSASANELYGGFGAAEVGGDLPLTMMTRRLSHDAAHKYPQGLKPLVSRQLFGMAKPCPDKALSLLQVRMITGAPIVPISFEHDTDDGRGHKIGRGAGEHGANAQAGELVSFIGSERADAANLDADRAEVGKTAKSVSGDGERARIERGFHRAEAAVSDEFVQDLSLIHI